MTSSGSRFPRPASNEGTDPAQRTTTSVSPLGSTSSVEATDVRVGYVGPGVPCGSGGGYAPTGLPGEEFWVCVTVTVRIPFLPEFVDANTATGQFVVERDRYVDG